jgi:hypothetical protein
MICTAQASFNVDTLTMGLLQAELAIEHFISCVPSE